MLPKIPRRHWFCWIENGATRPNARDLPCEMRRPTRTPLVMHTREGAIPRCDAGGVFPADVVAEDGGELLRVRQIQVGTARRGITNLRARGRSNGQKRY